MITKFRNSTGATCYKTTAGRARKRSLKSIYYDRMTNTVGAATTMYHKQPHLRPNRYLFLFQSFQRVHNIFSNKVRLVLKENGIFVPKAKESDLPF